MGDPLTALFITAPSSAIIGDSEYLMLAPDPALASQIAEYRAYTVGDDGHFVDYPLVCGSDRPLMEHKGIQYQVVETANPRGWKWTVQLPEGRIKTGVSFSRGHAIFYAINAIDLALSALAQVEHGRP